jgi:hypothetical protein
LKKLARKQDISNRQAAVNEKWLIRILRTSLREGNRAMGFNKREFMRHEPLKNVETCRQTEFNFGPLLHVVK